MPFVLHCYVLLGEKKLFSNCSWKQKISHRNKTKCILKPKVDNTFAWINNSQKKFAADITSLKFLKLSCLFDAILFIKLWRIAKFG